MGMLNSPNFLKWFGKSVVKDAGGEPLRVYHGSTSKKLNIIDPKAAVETQGVSWFSDNPDVSEIFRYPREYGDVLWDYKPGAMIEGHLSIKNPLIIEGKLAQDITYDSALQQRVVKKAIRDGYDGIILKDVQEGVGDNMAWGTTYGIFSPTQVKSVKNRGTFNPTDPNILKSVGAGLGLMGAAGAMYPSDAEAMYVGPKAQGIPLKDVITKMGVGAPVGAILAEQLAEQRRREQNETLQEPTFDPTTLLAGPARWGGGLMNMGIDTLMRIFQ